MSLISSCTSKIHCIIIDCTDTIYNARTAITQALGGIERCVVSLSKILSEVNGWEVTVYNSTPEGINDNGVQWSNISDLDMGKFSPATVVIACNDPCLFDLYHKKTGQRDFLPVLWMHNLSPITKVIRKGRFSPLLRWRPVGVFLSEYHQKTTSKFLPFRARVVIGHGVEDSVIDYPTPNFDTEKERTACFISLPYRGLSEVLRMWKSIIHPKFPDFRLDVYCNSPTENDLDFLAPESLKEIKVHIVGRKPRSELNQGLANSRALLIPWDKGETFCLSAAESVSLGVPVVTKGVGALSERVMHGKTGYITKSNEEFAEMVMHLLTDDNLWQELHRNCLETKETHRWFSKAVLWQDMIESYVV